MSEFNEARRRVLEDEHEGMKKLREESRRFEFTAFGAPPTRYEVTFHCRGLVGLAGDEPLFSEEHKAEIILHPDYPLAEDSVEIQWKTDILHPNIDLEHGPCIKGTPLGASITIAEICEFLAEMIQYTRSNPHNRWKSETSSQAAKWMLSHPEAFPLDRTPLRDRGGKTAER